MDAPQTFATDAELVAVARGVVEVARALVDRFGVECLGIAPGVAFCRQLVDANDRGTRGNQAVQKILDQIAEAKASARHDPPVVYTKRQR